MVRRGTVLPMWNAGDARWRFDEKSEGYRSESVRKGARDEAATTPVR